MLEALLLAEMPDWGWFLMGFVVGGVIIWLWVKMTATGDMRWPDAYSEPPKYRLSGRAERGRGVPWLPAGAH